MGIIAGTGHPGGTDRSVTQQNNIGPRSNNASSGGQPFGSQPASTSTRSTSGGGHPYASQPSPFNPTQYSSVMATSARPSAPIPVTNYGFSPAPMPAPAPLAHAPALAPTPSSYFGFNANPTPTPIAAPLVATTTAQNYGFNSTIRDATAGASIGTSYLLGALSTSNTNRAPIIDTFRTVPQTHNHAGSKIALRFGGTDPIFQIGTRTMFENGKEPFARLDVGPLETNKQIFSRTGEAFADSNTFRGRGNFLHYNTKGFNGLNGANTPLLGNAPIPNHRTFVNGVQAMPDTFPIRGGTLARGAGRSLAVVGVAMDVHKIATAENKVEASAQVAGGMAGAVAGAKGGAVVGATIGTFIGGPVGTAVGGFAGGLIGGAAGYWAGSKAGDFVYDQKEAIVDGVKNVGGAVWSGAQHVGGFLAQPAHVQATQVASATYNAVTQVDDVLLDGASAVGDKIGDAASGVKKFFGW